MGTRRAVDCNAPRVTASALVVRSGNEAWRTCGTTASRKDPESRLRRLPQHANDGAVVVDNSRMFANTTQRVLIAKDARKP